jgi:ABC-2 type transport system permease protein
VQATMTRPESAVPAPTTGLLRAALASEATKLRSVRSTVWTLFATLFVTIGIGALICLARVSRWDQLDAHERLTFDPTSFSLRGIFLAQLAIGVLGVLVISSEYSTGMIRTTLAAIPQRRVVLAAKVAVFAVVAFVVATVASVAAFLVGQSILAQKSAGISLSQSGAVRAVLGAGLYLTVIGLLGVALGTLLRRAAGAIATLFGLVLVLPALVSALPSPWNTDVGKYLPSAAGEALFTLRPTSDQLRPGVALAVLVAYVVVALALAGVALARRDA